MSKRHSVRHNLPSPTPNAKTPRRSHGEALAFSER